MEIHPSARKHGVADEDIRHAVRQAMALFEQPRRRLLYLGPSRDSGMLEVVTLIRAGRSELAIHAMPMRRKYMSLLGPAT